MLKKIILLEMIILAVFFIGIKLIIACPNIALLTAEPNPVLIGEIVQYSWALEPGGWPWTGNVKWTLDGKEVAEMPNVFETSGVYHITAQLEGYNPDKPEEKAWGKVGSVDLTVYEVTSVTGSPTVIQKDGNKNITITATLNPDCNGPVEWERKVGSGGWQSIAETGKSITLSSSESVGTYKYRARAGKEDNWAKSEELVIIKVAISLYPYVNCFADGTASNIKAFASIEPKTQTNGTYLWSIAEDSKDKIALVSDTTANNIFIKGIKKSATIDDATVNLKYTLRGVSIDATRNLTVIVPNALSVLSDTFAQFSYPLYGCIRVLVYQVMNQFNSSIKESGKCTEIVVQIGGFDLKHKWGGGNIDKQGTFSVSLAVIRTTPFPGGWFLNLTKKYIHMVIMLDIMKYYLGQLQLMLK